MERLEFGQGSHYSAMEASIHLSRYLSAKPYCSGKRVLDIACGEGYGSALLARWGAESVVGVDISADAVHKASSLFASDKVRFVCSSGEGLTAEIGQFDLIVSLETIEHVEDPTRFLENVKGLLAPGGIAIISCPNDHWYYADGGSNPYHLHRWTADEFKALTEGVLGKASWAYGTFGIGFATYMEQGSLRTLGEHDPQEAMLRFQPLQDGILTHMEQDSGPSAESVAYFIGVWGSEAPKGLFAGYPVSMELTRYMQFKLEYVHAIRDALADKDERLRLLGVEHFEEMQTASEEVRAAGKELEKANEEAQAVTAELESVKAALVATTDELSFAKREIRQLKMMRRISVEEAELIRWQLGHHQYLLSMARSHADELQNRVDMSQDELHRASETLATVPWRVVGIWRRLRGYIPAAALSSGARLLDAMRRRRT